MAWTRARSGSAASLLWSLTHHVDKDQNSVNTCTPLQGAGSLTQIGLIAQNMSGHGTNKHRSRSKTGCCTPEQSNVCCYASICHLKIPFNFFAFLTFTFWKLGSRSIRWLCRSTVHIVAGKGRAGLEQVLVIPLLRSYVSHISLIFLLMKKFQATTVLGPWCLFAQSS